MYTYCRTVLGGAGEEVGKVLYPYSADQRYQVYGFGGVPRFIPELSRTTSHCFNLSGNMQNPYIQGFENVLLAYHSTLDSISLSGPTFFSHVLAKVIDEAKSKLNEMVY